MQFLSGWAVRGSIGLALFFGDACATISMDNTFGTSLIVWSDIRDGHLPDFAIHSQGMQLRSRDNKPIIFSRKGRE